MSILKRFFQSDEAATPRAHRSEQRGAAPTPEQPTKAAAVATQTLPGDSGGVIVRPLVTEKAGALEASGKYAFAVRRDATKLDVAAAVLRTYGVKPDAVRVVNVRGKRRVRGRISGQTQAWRKAVVSLPLGKRITVREGA